MLMRDFIDADGNFLVYLHKPSYRVRNLRTHDRLAILGYPPDPPDPADPATASDHRTPPAAERTAIDNRVNFPPGDLTVDPADPVYEIPNPFSFRGSSYICRSWAEQKAAAPESIRLPPAPEVSLRQSLAGHRDQPEVSGHGVVQVAASGTAMRASAREPAQSPLSAVPRERLLLARLPRPLQLTLAATSTDPADLTALAALSCELIMGADHTPTGLRYQPDGRQPLIHDHELYDTVANNPHLPAGYRQVMVLRPGAQGGSEIIGEYGGPGQPTHVFEYLRRNSYIPWGHYAANLADDAIRYRIAELTAADLTGLRHLYYQRTFIRLAEMLELPVQWQRRGLTAAELEQLRRRVLAALRPAEPGRLPFTATLWGWNFGYDCSGSGFRLHASHQQVHQQYALIPPPPAFACGDQVAACGREFRRRHGRGLFAAYLAALRQNHRTDGRTDAPCSLLIHEDEQVLLLVPKAQVSQWELQLIAKGQVGNILEADPACRAALDRALLLAQRILAALGATLVTSIEYSKRLDDPDRDQRLLYSLLPKLPYAMGAFSEAQQRWICGHYPEDFAACCRQAMARLPAP